MTYDTHESAVKAIEELNETNFQNRTIYVERFAKKPIPDKKIHVSNLPPHTSREDLKSKNTIFYYYYLLLCKLQHKIIFQRLKLIKNSELIKFDQDPRKFQNLRNLNKSNF